MGFYKTSLIDVLLLFVPISAFIWMAGWPAQLLFVCTVLAIIPIASRIWKATESLSAQANPAIGGLANATFGNIIELLIAVIAIRQGLMDLVKASLVGSIIANVLLLVGLSVFFGGLRFKEQKFNQHSAGVSSTMLIIAITGISIPSLLALTGGQQAAFLGDTVALLMALIYVAGLVFSLKTHKHLFSFGSYYRERHKPLWTINQSLVILIIFVSLAAIESEFLVSSVQKTAANLGLSQAFIGITIIAILTNLAEKSAAITMALKNKIDISLEIGSSSATQIALFVLPLLVLAGHLMGKPFSPVFSLFQLVAMFFTVMIINYLSADGRCNWLEGAQLITVYLILAAAFYFV